MRGGIPPFFWGGEIGLFRLPAGPLGATAGLSSTVLVETLGGSPNSLLDKPAVAPGAAVPQGGLSGVSLRYAPATHCLEGSDILHFLLKHLVFQRQVHYELPQPGVFDFQGL